MRQFVLNFKSVGSDHLDTLRDCKDLKVFALLQDLAGASSLIPTMRKTRIDLLKRLGSKSPQASMVKQLLRYACMTTVDVSSIAVVCDLALSTGSAETDKTKKKKSKKSRKSSRAEVNAENEFSQHEVCLASSSAVMALTTCWGRHTVILFVGSTCRPPLICCCSSPAISPTQLPGSCCF